MFKRQKVVDDPELFATYSAIAQEAQEVVQSHVDELVGLAQIVESGISSGEFKVSDQRKAEGREQRAEGKNGFHPLGVGTLLMRSLLAVKKQLLSRCWIVYQLSK